MVVHSDMEGRGDDFMKSMLLLQNNLNLLLQNTLHWYALLSTKNNSLATSVQDRRDLRLWRIYLHQLVRVALMEWGNTSSCRVKVIHQDNVSVNLNHQGNVSLDVIFRLVVLPVHD